MDKYILKALLYFVRLFNKQQFDFEQLKIITETKILMDRRRSLVTFKQQQQKQMGNSLLGTLVVYFILGAMIGLILFSLQSILFAMILIHAYLLFMMSITLVTDFSSILIDTTDNQIILPKPVTGRTLFLARVVHILVYLLQFSVALMIAPVIFTFIQYGILTGIGIVATTFLTVAFAVFITYLLYGLMLRFANERKIKDTIGYFQIFMTVLFVVGFQIVPRLIDFKDPGFSFTLHTYTYLLPPVWMAMVLEALQQLNFDSVHLVMIFCAIAIPVFTTWLMVKYLAPSFAKKLGALSTSADQANNKVVSQRGKKAFSQKLSRLLCKGETEIAAFEFVWKITGRDKNFKIQFYPGLAYVPIFLFLIIFKNGRHIAVNWHGLLNTEYFLAFIYVPVLGVATGLTVIGYSDNFAAAWLYQSTPLLKPGELILGSIKVLLVKFFFPFYMVFFTVACFIWGAGIIDDFVFGFFNNVLIIVAVVNLSDHYLPFSRQQSVKQQSGKLVKAFLQMAIIGLFIGAHYLALKTEWLPAMLVPFSAAVGYFLMKRVRHLPWAKISF